MFFGVDGVGKAVQRWKIGAEDSAALREVVREAMLGGMRSLWIHAMDIMRKVVYATAGSSWA